MANALPHQPLRMLALKYRSVYRVMQTSTVPGPFSGNVQLLAPSACSSGVIAAAAYSTELPGSTTAATFASGTEEIPDTSYGSSSGFGHASGLSESLPLASGICGHASSTSSGGGHGSAIEPGIIESAAETTALPATGAFQRLPMVSQSKELLESALKRAARVPYNNRLKNEAKKAKNR
jgi:hypothetical protein